MNICLLAFLSNEVNTVRIYLEGVRVMLKMLIDENTTMITKETYFWASVLLLRDISLFGVYHFLCFLLNEPINRISACCLNCHYEA